MGRISYELFKEACHLIESGHTKVLDYGFSYFIAALNEHSLIQGQKKRVISEAVRWANKADDKQYKKFMRGKN